MPEESPQPIIAETPWYVWAALFAAGAYVLYSMDGASSFAEMEDDEEED